tara:strand:+ start:986 stop:1177 length:192 start_codon:yes stop_codon:yes gene_type:complete
MTKAFEILIRFGPLFFGVLFLAPVLSEILDKLSFSIPYFSNLTFSLIIGFLWGTYACFKKSWV